MNSTEKKSVWKELFKALTPILLLMALVFLLFQYVLMLSEVPSESMETTIMTGDLLVSNRLDTDNIERYDIVVFEAPDDPDTYYIKRVIGLPGETITVADGKVYADGGELDDSFVAEEMNSSGDGVYEVPEGCYFMMGDNRNHSSDSRFWANQYVPQSSIVAKAVIIIFPFAHIQLLT